jgi:hypothetical protein
MPYLSNTAEATDNRIALFSDALAEVYPATLSSGTVTTGTNTSYPYPDTWSYPGTAATTITTSEVNITTDTVIHFPSDYRFDNSDNVIDTGGTTSTLTIQHLGWRIIPAEEAPPDEVYLVDENGVHWVHGDPKERTRRKLKQQMAPALINHRGERPRCLDSPAADFSSVKQNEIVALQLLKKMVDPARWRKYLKYGFVEVHGKSGMVYQIIRGQQHVRVFKRGVKVCELCVALKNRHVMPPTDEVISRMIIAECDEPDLWKRANVYMHGSLSRPRSYTDAALELVARQVAA